MGQNSAQSARSTAHAECRTMYSPSMKGSLICGGQAVSRLVHKDHQAWCIQAEHTECARARDCCAMQGVRNESLTATHLTSLRHSEARSTRRPMRPKPAWMPRCERRSGVKSERGARKALHVSIYECKHAVGIAAERYWLPADVGARAGVRHCARLRRSDGPPSIRVPP